MTIAPAAATCSQMYHNLHKNELMYTRNKLDFTVTWSTQLIPHQSAPTGHCQHVHAAQSVTNESSLEIKTEYTENAQVAHNIKLF